MAVIILWDGCSDKLLNIYLRKQIANIAQSKVDVYVYNKFEKENCNIENKYLKLGIPNLYYVNDVDKLLWLISGRYEYVWMNQPEYIIRFEQIGSVLAPIINNSFDIIVAENDWKDEGNKGIFLYDDAKDILKNYFINMYSVGTVIYSMEFLEKIYYEIDLHEIKNEGDLVGKIFSYAANSSVNCVGCIDEIYDRCNFNHIFRVNDYVDKWTIGLERLVMQLPDAFDEQRNNLLDLKGSFWDPFTRQRIINLKMENAFCVADKRKNIAENNLLIAQSPKKIGKFLLSYKDKKLGRTIKFWISGLRDTGNNIKKSFGKYNGIDFESDACCVVPQNEVPSELVYGDLNFVREPWITIMIPVYKRADLLEDTINSILGQEDINHSWDIVIVDNEEVEDGGCSEVEELIRKIDSPRILYYRNKKNLGVAGNYNRGIELARGKWVSMLHSDDLLVKGYLVRAERMLETYTKRVGREIGYISASYLSFYSENIQEDNYWKIELKVRDEEIYDWQQKKKPILIRVRRNEFMVTGAVGVSLPSNGTIMNRKAVLEMGGFNDDLGICADMVLPLRMMKKYAVFRTDEIMGHYRVGKRNISASDDNAYKVEKNYWEIREYYYRKNIFGRLMGLIFRQQHFFMVDNILGRPYWGNGEMQQLFKYRRQPIRDWIMFSRWGIANLFYKTQRRIAIMCG